MKHLATVLTVLHAVNAHSVPSSEQAVLGYELNEKDFRIPTVHESAVQARRILHLSSIGALVTTFTDTSSPIRDDFATSGSHPSELSGSGIGLMEYYADCEPGNPTLLAIDIATPYKNYAAGSNISLAVRWWPVSTNKYSSFFSRKNTRLSEIPTPHTPAALPRFSLHGHLEEISATDLAKHAIPACFLKTHPDSVLWQPGNHISHSSRYVRLVVEHVYWFGGFGDRARIGWLPIDEWRNVTMKEIVACELPGEKQQKSSWFKEWL